MKNVSKLYLSTLIVLEACPVNNRNTLKKKLKKMHQKTKEKRTKEHLWEMNYIISEFVEKLKGY